MRFDFDAFDEQQDLLVPFAPVPASRPKVARFGTYYSKRHQQYMKDFAKFVIAENIDWRFLEKEKRVFIIIEFACERPKKLTNQIPHFDLDNLVKLPLDCMTSSDIFWHDDRQVEAMVASKRYAKKGEIAHTKISVFSL